MTITLTRKEAQQLLEVFELFLEEAEDVTTLEDNLVKMLRARLSAPEPEPVAYGVLDDDGQIDWTAEYPFSNEPGWPDSVPLYTAPPQREWQGLTDEEIRRADHHMVEGAYHYSFKQGAQWAEAKLREKNT